jgi:hypothetical protein
VRELHGRVLLKCFGGCGAVDVLGALGLNWSALFPPGDFAPIKERITARVVLESVAHEVDRAWFLLHDLQTQGALEPHQWERLTLATSRISDARDYIR